jgi:outer membrane protein
VDVLNAQQLYYSARRDLAQARYNFLMSRLRLKAEAGELDEEDLKEVNDVLFRPQFPGPFQPPLAAH